MRFAPVATVGMILFGVVAMGCSPSAKAPASPASVSTTTLTSTSVPQQPKRILPYVNFEDIVDDEDDLGPNDFDGKPTWGAAYAAYQGFDPELGF